MDPGSIEQLTAARYKIEELLRLVREGRIRVPRFQRPLKWTGTDVERLFDSIYRGFPIGTLLFWIRAAEADQVALGPVKIEAPAFTEANWVVDGQQRVTSLAASLLPASAAGNDPRFEIWFDLETERFGRGGRPSDTQLPIRLANDLTHVLSWIKERDLPNDHQARAFKLADQLRNYEIPAYLVRSDEEAALQDIFDRTNTSGKSMTKAEVFHALNTSTTERTADVNRLDTEIAAMGFGALKGNTLLYAVLATRGPNVLREFRSEFKSEDEQLTALARARDAVMRVRNFLQDEADVPHFDLVPYQHQLVGLIRFFALHPEPDHFILVLLRRWFWQAAEHGSLPRIGSTGTLDKTTRAIVKDDAYASVEALLRLTDTAPTDIVPRQFNWRAADTRIAVCALAHRKPVDPVDNNSIDVTASIELAGREALSPLVPPRSSRLLGTTVANRIFLSPSNDLSNSELSDLLRSTPETILHSLVLNSEITSLLASGDIDALLQIRTELVTALIHGFLKARTERSASVHRPISELLADDG